MNLLFIISCAISVFILSRFWFEVKRERRKKYYTNTYLNSEAWARKRYVVLNRDNWTCVFCGAKATEVHHTRNARKQIGKEPIDWLVSVCKLCHEKQHPAKVRSYNQRPENKLIHRLKNWE